MQKHYTKEIAKFGKNVKMLRKEHSITQQELAGRCEVDVRTIQKIESGKYNTSLQVLYAIAEAFKIDISELFSY